MLTPPHLVQLGDDSGAHFARFGMTPQRLLREHQFPVDHHLELAAARRNQPPRPDKRLKLSVSQNFVRQTDGARGVVSGRAVFNTHVNQRVLHQVSSCP